VKEPRGSKSLYVLGPRKTCEDPQRRSKKPGKNGARRQGLAPKPAVRSKNEPAGQRSSGKKRIRKSLNNSSKKTEEASEKNHAASEQPNKREGARR